MNIYQRIAAVQKACTYFKKDTEVGYGGNKYKGVSHDGVLIVVREAALKAGEEVSGAKLEQGFSLRIK